MKSPQTLRFEIPDHLGGLRLDQAMGQLLPDYSRSRITEWIRQGQVQIDGVLPKPRHKTHGGEAIELQIPLEPLTEVSAEPLPLDIVHEDEALIILDKPPGLVVHPAAGHWSGTLQNALLAHCPDLSRVPRSGIVHRLDKDTSGLLMVAKTLESHKQLVAQLQARSVKREYLALLMGWPVSGGTLNEPIGRHPTDRKRFAVRPDGKTAITHFRIEERFRHHTLARVKLETGRTHQIRVHLDHAGYPLVGDPVYGGRSRLPAKANPELLLALKAFRRQALHAAVLGLSHPMSGEDLEWQAPIPPDFESLLDQLREKEPACM